MTDSLQLPGNWEGTVNRYRLVTASKIRGPHKGIRTARQTGTSQDFSDFREYHPGDDVRLIDWNVYGRTGKHYIKRFLEEQEMRAGIILDCSKSMDNKWLFARQLVYTLGAMVLQHEDRLAVAFAAERGVLFKGKGRTGRHRLERLLKELPDPEEMAFTELADRQAIQRQSILFIITDGLEPTEHWDVLLRRLVRRCGDIRLLFISTAEERNPADAGDLLLTDSETAEQIKVTAGQAALEKYREKRMRQLAELENISRRYGARILSLHTEDGIQSAVKHLANKNWIQ